MKKHAGHQHNTVRALASVGALAFALLLAAPASAQSISLPLQGYLTDDAGAPIDGSQSITIALYDAETGGTPIYVEASTAAVASGFFTHYVGATTPLDASVFAGGVQLFAGVSIAGGAEMSPRVEIGWVPYAAWAANAADAMTVGGMTPSAFASAAPGAGLATTGGSLTVDTGAIQSRVTGSCPTGQSIRQINADGTVSCETDDNTTYSAGTGLSESGGAFSVNYAGSGSANTTAHSDHTHPAPSWSSITGMPSGFADGTDDGVPRGVTFTRWGRGDCPGGTSLVYSGYAAGAHFQHGGAGSNTLCLASAPTWGVHNDRNDDRGLIYGVEYETNTGELGGAFTGVQDQDAPCAVCLDNSADSQFMYPGSQACPSGWNTRVRGYLMSTIYNQAKSTFVCVDQNPRGRTGSGANNNGNLWYPVEGECGSLPCGPYVQNRELTCSICTR